MATKRDLSPDPEEFDNFYAKVPGEGFYITRLGFVVLCVRPQNGWYQYDPRVRVPLAEFVPLSLFVATDNEDAYDEVDE